MGWAQILLHIFVYLRSDKMNTRIKTSITSIRPPSIRREDDKEGLPSRKAGDSKEINKTENPKTIPLLKMVEILNAEANSAKGSYFSGGDVKLKESKIYTLNQIMIRLNTDSSFNPKSLDDLRNDPILKKQLLPKAFDELVAGWNSRTKATLENLFTECKKDTMTAHKKESSDKTSSSSSKREGKISDTSITSLSETESIRSSHSTSSNSTSEGKEETSKSEIHSSRSKKIPGIYEIAKSEIDPDLLECIDFVNTMQHRPKLWNGMEFSHVQKCLLHMTNTVYGKKSQADDYIKENTKKLMENEKFQDFTARLTKLKNSKSIPYKGESYTSSDFYSNLTQILKQDSPSKGIQTNTVNSLRSQNVITAELHKSDRFQARGSTSGIDKEKDSSSSETVKKPPKKNKIPS